MRPRARATDCGRRRRLQPGAARASIARFVVSWSRHCYDLEMRKGIGVSPGVAVGTAYCIHEIFVNPDTRRLEKDEVLAELDRYDQARDKTAADLHALYQKVASQVGPDEAAIFRAHESILHDPAFTAKIRAWIVDERQSARRRAASAAGGIHGAVCQHRRRVHQGAAGRRARRGDPA